MPLTRQQIKSDVNHFITHFNGDIPQYLEAYHHAVASADTTLAGRAKAVAKLENKIKKNINEAFEQYEDKKDKKTFYLLLAQVTGGDHTANHTQPFYQALAAENSPLKPDALRTYLVAARDEKIIIEAETSFSEKLSQVFHLRSDLTNTVKELVEQCQQELFSLERPEEGSDDALKEYFMSACEIASRHKSNFHSTYPTLAKHHAYPIYIDAPISFISGLITFTLLIASLAIGITFIPLDLLSALATATLEKNLMGFFAAYDATRMEYEKINFIKTDLELPNLTNQEARDQFDIRFSFSEENKDALLKKSMTEAEIATLKETPEAYEQKIKELRVIGIKPHFTILKPDHVLTIAQEYALILESQNNPAFTKEQKQAFLVQKTDDDAYALEDEALEALYQHCYVFNYKPDLFIFDSDNHDADAILEEIDEINQFMVRLSTAFIPLTPAQWGEAMLNAYRSFFEAPDDLDLTGVDGIQFYALAALKAVVLTVCAAASLPVVLLSSARTLLFESATTTLFYIKFASAILLSLPLHVMDVYSAVVNSDTTMRFNSNAESLVQQVSDFFGSLFAKAPEAPPTLLLTNEPANPSLV
jgi:hypothetical protein